MAHIGMPRKAEIYLRKQTQTHRHAHRHTRRHTLIHTQTYTHTHTHMYTHTSTHACMLARMHMHACTHTCTDARACTHTCACTRTHTRSLAVRHMDLRHNSSCSVFLQDDPRLHDVNVKERVDGFLVQMSSQVCCLLWYESITISPLFSEHKQQDECILAWLS